MQQAIVISSHYDASSGYPNLGSWTPSAELLAARLAQHGYGVDRLLPGRGLVGRLRTSLRQENPHASVIVYFAGYALVTEKGDPALLMADETVTALRLAQLVSRLSRSFGRVMLLLDTSLGSAAPDIEHACKLLDLPLASDPTKSMAELALSTCEADNVSMLISVRPWRDDDQRVSPFARLLEQGLHALSNVDSATTDFELYAWLRQSLESQNATLRFRSADPAFIVLPRRQFPSNPAALSPSPMVRVGVMPSLPAVSMPAVPPPPAAPATARQDRGSLPLPLPPPLRPPPPEGRHGAQVEPPSSLDDTAQPTAVDHDSLGDVASTGPEPTVDAQPPRRDPAGHEEPPDLDYLFVPSAPGIAAPDDVGGGDVGGPSGAASDDTHESGSAPSETEPDSEDPTQWQSALESGEYLATLGNGEPTEASEVPAVVLGGRDTETAADVHNGPSGDGEPTTARVSGSETARQVEVRPHASSDIALEPPALEPLRDTHHGWGTHADRDNDAELHDYHPDATEPRAALDVTAHAPTAPSHDEQPPHFSEAAAMPTSAYGAGQPVDGPGSVVPVDSAHVDSAHVDSAHVDSAHVDSAHVDSAHVDSAHVDSAHVDSAHVDSAHVDSAHVDSAHVDSALMQRDATAALTNDESPPAHASELPTPAVVPTEQTPADFGAATSQPYPAPTGSPRSVPATSRPPPPPSLRPIPSRPPQAPAEVTGPESWRPPASGMPRQAEDEAGLVARARAASEAGHDEEALALAQHCLMLFPQSVAALQIAATLLAQLQRWEALAGLYEQLIAGHLDPRAVSKLCIAASRLYVSKLDSPTRAARALERACELQPKLPDPHLEAAALYEQVARTEAAESHYTAAIQVAPLDARCYRRASAFFAWIRETDAAWNAASVAAALGQVGPAETELLDKHGQDGLPRPARPLASPDFSSGLSASPIDPPLAQLLTLLAEPVRSATLPKPKAQQQLLKSYLRDEPATSTTTLARAFNWTCQMLGISVPQLYLVDGDQLPTLLPVSEAAWLVGKGLGRGSSAQELVFIWARALSRLRPEARASLTDMAGDLTTAVLATFAALGQATPQTEQSQRLAKTLKKRLDPGMKQAIEGRIEGMNPASLPSRIRAWERQLDLVGNRVGLLSCGSPYVAASVLGRFPSGQSSREEQLSDLFTFAMSQTYRDLREKLGLAFH